MNLNDWITLGLFVPVLFVMAVGGMWFCYTQGRARGHRSGVLDGIKRASDSFGKAIDQRQPWVINLCFDALADSFRSYSEPTLRGHSRPSIKHPFQGGTDPMDKTARHLPVSARNSSN